MRNDGPGMSRGTKIILGLTAVILLLSAAFLFSISGKDITNRAEQFLLQLEQNRQSQVQTNDEAELARVQEQSATPKPETEATAEPKATPAPEIHFSIAAAGTVNAPRLIRESVLQDDGDYDFLPVFEGISQAMQGADMSIVTLETMTAENLPYQSYNAPPSLLSALKQIGIDLVSLATEHALDHGYEALALTRADLNSAGLSWCGLEGEDTRLSIGGLRIAVLSGTYGFSEQSHRNGDTDRISSLGQAITNKIASVRADGVNLVIVIPHWGIKNSPDISEEMRIQAREWAAAGADLILGAHPNVVLPSEMLHVERPDGRLHDCLVYYSLGALLTDGRNAENSAGVIARISLYYDPESRLVDFERVNNFPTYIAQVKKEDEQNWRVLIAGEDLPDLPWEEQQGALSAKAIIEEVLDATENP